MAIKMISNYSKRLGLPGYSSHQFSVSVETELVATDDIPAESARLYQLLQTNVDKQIETTGFVPSYDYGMEPVTDNNGTAPATHARPPTAMAEMATVPIGTGDPHGSAATNNAT